MMIVCLDLEGVLFPEIWAAFSEACGISEIRYTTRDEPDYDTREQSRISFESSRHDINKMLYNERNRFLSSKK